MNGHARWNMLLQTLHPAGVRTIGRASFVLLQTLHPAGVRRTAALLLQTLHPAGVRSLRRALLLQTLRPWGAEPPTGCATTNIAPRWGAEPRTGRASRFYKHCTPLGCVLALLDPWSELDFTDPSTKKALSLNRRQSPFYS